MRNSPIYMKNLAIVKQFDNREPQYIAICNSAPSWIRFRLSVLFPDEGLYQQYKDGKITKEILYDHWMMDGVMYTNWRRLVDKVQGRTWVCDNDDYLDFLKGWLEMIGETVVILGPEDGEEDVDR